MTLRRRWRLDGGEPASSLRLETLADGVFAIVMTLLVLELAVPATSGATSGEVSAALRDMWPEFLIYALSFLVLGVFWLIHKMIFDSIVGADPPLIWLNVLFLMVTALVPFSTALVGEYRVMEVAAAVYGLNLLLGFSAAWAVWAYATRRNGLAVADLPSELVRGGNRMGLVYVLILMAATAVAFVSPLTAYAAYAAFSALIIGLTMLGRWESAMVWTLDRDAQADATPSARHGEV